MKMIRHIFEQPFIAATGAAALLHSTWSLATLFAGEQPESLLHLAGWLIPALLIAFALDVGQISTSAQIRESGLTVARAVTFFVFAVATWYLQFLYIVHHMPALELSAGISDAHRQAALVLRDFAMWLIPALLPISTVLYTFSGDNSQQHEQKTAESEQLQQQPTISIENPQEPAALPDMPLLAAEHPDHRATCDCGWMKDGYTSQDSADRALRAHQQHCTYEHVPNGAAAHVDSD